MAQLGRMINTSTAMSSDRLIEGLDPARPVLIAGPTASGKSALALRIAQALGGAVVNADALQVWSCWRVLTARPSPEDEAAASDEAGEATASDEATGEEKSEEA